MITVLSVQHYPTYGGPYNELLELAPVLEPLGVTTRVVMTDEEGTAYQRLLGRVPLQRIRLSRARWSLSPLVHLRVLCNIRSDIERLREVIRAVRPDVVKVHGPHNPQGAWAATGEGTPVVWVVSSTGLPRTLRRIGMHLVSRYGHSVLTNGAATVRCYPGWERLEGRTFTYYPPVDIGRFTPGSPRDRVKLRREFNWPEDSEIVCTIANVNRHKGIDDFVRMAVHVLRRRPRARFLIVGAMPSTQRRYVKFVKEMAKGKGLVPDHLVFTGARDDVASVLKGADVKVISSVPASEGTTTTAAEAGAAGVPVVTTRVGAIDEIVQDGVTGFVVPPRSIVLMADRVVELLERPEVRRAMGEAARLRVGQRFSREACAQVHLAAYQCAMEVARIR